MNSFGSSISLRHILGRLFSREVKDLLRRSKAAVRNLGLNRQCNICGSFIRRFDGHKNDSDKEYYCPVCGSKPPHRLAMMFMCTDRMPWRADGILLHVAPEPGLGRRLRRLAKRHQMRYVSGSISGQGDQYLDILSLPFPDRSIDIIYCCHVLNCMPDDQAAMREVRRVLRPDGVALLQVPAFYTGSDTLEAKSLEERVALFADEGIFRAYTPTSYLGRLNAAGFEAEVYSGCSVSRRERDFHVLYNEVLHVCRPS